MFGSDNWDVFELRSQLGIVSSDLHHRFVFGNNEGRVTGGGAVLSGFFATQGILRYGVVTDEMRRRAAEALARMGVSHLARRRLDEMSSGEARRVLLARALVTAPRALVLDEPTTGLDLVARHAFMERVRQIAREGTTLILITHHIEEIVPEIERVHPAARRTHRRRRARSVGADRANSSAACSTRRSRLRKTRAITTRGPGARQAQSLRLRSLVSGGWRSLQTELASVGQVVRAVGDQLVARFRSARVVRRRREVSPASGAQLFHDMRPRRRMHEKC